MDSAPARKCSSRFVDHLRAIVIFRNHLHRHERVPASGSVFVHRSGIKVEDRRRIERVAIHANERLLLDGPSAGDCA